MSTKYYRFGFTCIKFKGSVQVHRFEILKVRVRFRFNDLKFKRFRFGSGSPKKCGLYRFAVRFDSLDKFFKQGSRRRDPPPPDESREGSVGVER